MIGDTFENADGTWRVLRERTEYYMEEGKKKERQVITSASLISPSKEWRDANVTLPPIPDPEKEAVQSILAKGTATTAELLTAVRYLAEKQGIV